MSNTKLPEIEDCACGHDHETMPLIDVSFCGICDRWDCDHDIRLVEAVCRKHKRHVPCRPCMREEKP